MKKFLSLLSLTLAVFTLSLTATEENEAVKKDMALLQGKWDMTAGTTDGYAIPAEMVSNLHRICEGNEVTVNAGPQVIMKAKITIDPSKTPKTIDYEITGGSNKGKKQLGIYEIDGDTLKSCFGAPGAERPTDFTSKEGEKRTATEWKKQKPVEKEGKK